MLGKRLPNPRDVNLRELIGRAMDLPFEGIERSFHATRIESVTITFDCCFDRSMQGAEVKSIHVSATVSNNEGE